MREVLALERLLEMARSQCDSPAPGTSFCRCRRGRRTPVWRVRDTAVFLAIDGIYGLVSYAVSQREQEIGLRKAIGAAQQDVQRILRQAASWRKCCAGDLSLSISACELPADGRQLHYSRCDHQRTWYLLPLHDGIPNGLSTCLRQVAAVNQTVPA